MTTAIIVALLLVTLHFIYDGIILPTIRLHLRNRLFALRDEIREVMVREGRKSDDEAFMFVHDGICNFLNRLPDVTLHLKSQIERQLEADAELREKTQKRIALIEASDSEELLEIFHRTNATIEKAFIANAGAWLLYLIPIAVLIASVKKLSSLATELVAMPSSYTERFIPLHK